MAAFDAPSSPQYERDLRSAHKDFKRNRDSVIKWSYGTRNPANINVSDLSREDSPKVRPMHTHSKFTNKAHHNIVKAHRGNYLMPAGRVRNYSEALLEIDDAKRLSTVDMAGSLYKASKGAEGLSASDSASVLYSYDNTDSPPPVLTLDVFVKPNIRATEKLVEKEYEVLDDNGDAVKGRKARQVLRKAAAASSPSAGPSTAVSASGKAPLIEVLDEEDFELV